MRRLRDRIFKKYPKLNPKDFCYAIDDTANHRYGKNVFRSGKFGSSGGVYSGQKVLLIVLVDIRNKIAIPLSYAFLTSKKDSNHIPGHEVAIKLFREILGSNFPSLPVTADSWFDSYSFMLNLLKLGLHYSGEIKSNRKVMGKRGRVWKSLKSYFQGQKRRRTTKNKFYTESEVYIRKVSQSLKIIAVFNNQEEKKAFAYYVSTDVNMVGARLWRLSRARWYIECLFRDMKQNLSFGRIPCCGEGAADLSVCIPLILITSLRLDSDLWQIDEYTTIGAKVKKIREEAFIKSIDFIARKPNDKKVARFSARRSHINNKPTNNAAEAA